MLKVAAIFLAFIAASEQAAPPRAGIMVTAEGCSVLAMEGQPLSTGTSITLVTVDNPQRVSRAVITGQLPDSEIMAKQDLPGPYYAIEAIPSSTELPRLAVAVTGRFEFEQIESAVLLRAGRAANPIRVRSCTSYEGLHLTLWAGEPLKSSRLWHKYYYLGYDVEPTCQPADYQDDD